MKQPMTCVSQRMLLQLHSARRDRRSLCILCACVLLGAKKEDNAAMIRRDAEICEFFLEHVLRSLYFVRFFHHRRFQKHIGNFPVLLEGYWKSPL